MASRKPPRAPRTPFLTVARRNKVQEAAYTLALALAASKDAEAFCKVAGVLERMWAQDHRVPAKGKGKGGAGPATATPATTDARKAAIQARLTTLKQAAAKAVAKTVAK